MLYDDSHLCRASNDVIPGPLMSCCGSCGLAGKGPPLIVGLEVTPVDGRLADTAAAAAAAAAAPGSPAAAAAAKCAGRPVWERKAAWAA